jgi:hypothetical protein
MRLGPGIGRQCRGYATAYCVRRTYAAFLYVLSSTDKTEDIGLSYPPAGPTVSTYEDGTRPITVMHLSKRSSQEAPMI